MSNYFLKKSDKAVLEHGVKRKIFDFEFSKIYGPKFGELTSTQKVLLIF